ncbi:unnamed protein product, partial [Didymodactylos carnosus]
HELVQTLSNTIKNLRKTRRGEWINAELKTIALETGNKAKIFKQVSWIISEFVNEMTEHWKTAILDRKLLQRVVQLPVEITNTIPLVLREIQNIAQTQKVKIENNFLFFHMGTHLRINMIKLTAALHLFINILLIDILIYFITVTFRYI